MAGCIRDDIDRHILYKGFRYSHPFHAQEHHTKKMLLPDLHALNYTEGYGKLKNELCNRTEVLHFGKIRRMVVLVVSHIFVTFLLLFPLFQLSDEIEKGEIKHT